MDKKHYYHGSPRKFEKFSAEFCRSGSGNEQYGSGFYFTSNKTEAGRYAGDNGFIYEVELSPNKLITVPLHNDEEDLLNPPLSQKQIAGIITDAPDFRETLMNFGDVGSEGLRRVLDMAVSAYSRHSPLAAMNSLGTDFYRDQEDEVLKSIIKHTGIDGIHVPRDDGDEYIISMDPGNINIINIERSIKSVLEEENVERVTGVKP